MSAAPDLSEAAAEVCRLRGYEFLGQLGQGAFKSAYLVDTASGRAALKLAVISGSPDRLLRESAALQTCDHSSVARLLDVFPHQYQGSSIWVVLEEFLSGGTLEQRLRGKVLLPDQVRRLGVCLAEVLQHLHDRRLVHRDIKPANILFRDDPLIPVVTDFGVVRMLDEPSLTRTFLGMGPGTPAYAAPEQLNNERAQIGWRTDQFGVAIVLAECLTGHHPFLPLRGTVYDAINAVATKQKLPTSTRDELVALGFDCLLQALEPWPVSRYRRPQEFIEALQTR